ncbi:hypothetical protein CVT26_011918, partial [Gymnopilus dilepis]
MPPEIVSCIFELYTRSSSSAPLPNPLTLGAVCQTWRRIAWSTRKLWTELHVRVDVCITNTKVEVAKAWLERSGSLPLMINFEDRAKLPWENAPPKIIDFRHALQSLIRLVNQYSSRWEELHLSLSPSVMKFFDDTKRGPLSLRKVNLTIPKHLQEDPIDEEMHFTVGAPDNLVVDNLLVDNLTIPWETVTKLHVNEVSTKEMVDFMRMSPYLESVLFRAV